MRHLAPAWLELARRVGARDDVAGAGAALLGRWAEPHRAYHDLAHLSEVLERVDLGRAEPLVVEGWAAGMGHVLASSLARAADGWQAVVVLLGDQPLVPGAAVARVVDAWRAGAGPVVTATYGGRPGHPKLFDRSLLPDLLRLSGDAGARDLVAAHPGWVHRVEVGDLGSDADVDVEADLERVGAMLTLTNRRVP